jgi:hypothetical protein
MNSKTLLISAAALAAGVMTSQAQVYSQNIVGYINVPLNTGFNLVANQLDLDGTGTNNSIYTTVGTNLPSGTFLYAWNGTGFTSSKLNALGKWLTNNQIITNAVNPGAGFFLDVAAPTNVTFVGNVITGTNTYAVPAGFQVLSPSGPVAGTLDTTNGYTPTKGDFIYVFNGSGYNSHKYSGTAWLSGDPQIAVGQAVFFDSASNTNWTQILNVQ